MKEQYEQKISELTIGKRDAEEELKNFKSHFATVEQFGKDQAKMVTQQQKEIETYKKDLARMLKGHESQLKLAQDGNKALYEEKQRFLIEIKKLKEELKQAL